MEENLRQNTCSLAKMVLLGLFVTRGLCVPRVSVLIRWVLCICEYLSSPIGYPVSRRSDDLLFSVCLNISISHGVPRVESCFLIWIFYLTRKIYRISAASFLQGEYHFKAAAEVSWKKDITIETFWFQFLGCSTWTVSFIAARRLSWTLTSISITL